MIVAWHVRAQRLSTWCSKRYSFHLLMTAGFRGLYTIDIRTKYGVLLRGFWLSIFNFFLERYFSVSLSFFRSLFMLCKVKGQFEIARDYNAYHFSVMFCNVHVGPFQTLRDNQGDTFLMNDCLYILLQHHECLSDQRSSLLGGGHQGGAEETSSSILGCSTSPVY